jgi:GDPmannose 4,6-dehydratase
VREFAELAFGQVGRRLEWRGRGVDEVGLDARSGETLIRVDPRYFRPTEVDVLVGDPSKARKLLGWRHSVSFAELVREMVASDIAVVAEEARSREIGNELP